MDKLNFDPSAPTFLERVYEELGNASDHDISIVVWTLSVMGCIMLFFGLVPKTLKGYDDKRDQIKRMQLMKTIDPVKFHGLEDILKDVIELRDIKLNMQDADLPRGDDFWKCDFKMRLSTEIRRMKLVEASRSRLSLVSDNEEDDEEAAEEEEAALYDAQDEVVYEPIAAVGDNEVDVLITMEQEDEEDDDDDLLEDATDTTKLISI